MDKFDENGWEIPDTRPVARPAGFSQPVSLVDQMRSMVRRELSDRAQMQGFETFDEADDFEVGDDYDPKSPHELDEQAELLPRWNEKEVQRGVREEANKRFQGSAAPSSRPNSPADGPPAPVSKAADKP